MLTLSVGHFLNLIPLDLTVFLLALLSEAITTKNKLGMLPLRVALRNKVTTPIIMDLIQAYPQSVETFGLSGKTVLHLACMYHSDLAVVDRILSKYDCSHNISVSNRLLFDTYLFDRSVQVFGPNLLHGKTVLGGIHCTWHVSVETVTIS